MRRGGKTDKEKSAVGSNGGLTALHLIAHITAVIPAITLQFFGDADARITGELHGASCS